MKMMFNSFENAEILTKEFEGASDRAAAIVGGAFLDEVLSELLQQFLVPDKKSDEKVFEGAGPLSTFSFRIEMAFRLGLISKRERDTLHTIRSMRNDFAHQLKGISFSSQSIRARCQNIETPVELIAPKVIPLSKEGEAPPLPAIDKADSDNPRALFQETVITLMHVLAARYCQAAASTRSSPEEFEVAHEPGNVVLNSLKKNFAQIQELQREYAELVKKRGVASEHRGDEGNEDQKMLLLIKVQEFCVKQIEAAHAEHAKKI